MGAKYSRPANVGKIQEKIVQVSIKSVLKNEKVPTLGLSLDSQSACPKESVEHGFRKTAESRFVSSDLQCTVLHLGTSTYMLMRQGPSKRWVKISTKSTKSAHFGTAIDHQLSSTCTVTSGTYSLSRNHARNMSCMQHKQSQKQLQ